MLNWRPKYLKWPRYKKYKNKVLSRYVIFNKIRVKDCPTDDDTLKLKKESLRLYIKKKKSIPSRFKILFTVILRVSVHKSTLKEIN